MDASFDGLIRRGSAERLVGATEAVKVQAYTSNNLNLFRGATSPPARPGRRITGERQTRHAKHINKG